MKRRVKRRSRAASRKSGWTRLAARLARVPLIILSLAGLLAAAALVALFVLSTLFTWLFDTHEEVPEPSRDMTLEILNGCGVGGAAKELTSILRQRGFVVTDFRNADSFDHDTTIVTVRNVAREEGQAFAAYLGCSNVIEEEIDREKADIGILVGEDWKDLAIVAGRDESRDSLERMIDFLKRMTYFK
jgi:hypothetical protein